MTLTAEEQLLLAVGEIERLRWEVAALASSLNGLRESRLIRLFDRYRQLRARFRRFLRENFGLGQATLPPQAQPHPPSRDYDLLFFSLGNWHWRYQRPQHLAVQWARHRYRVFFISPDFRSSVNPANAHPPRPYSAVTVQDNLVEVHLAGPEKLHPLSKRPLDSELAFLVTSVLSMAEDWQITSAVSLVESPFWGPLVLYLRELRGWKVVYDCMDHLRGVLPYAHSMLSEEPRLIREADLVVASARLLIEKLAEENSNLCLLPNAADVEHFGQTPSTNPLAFLSRPIIGYFGAIAPWFDIQLIQFLATRHPEWNFVLIGSGRTSVKTLRGITNVHLLGEVPYRELPAYLHAFDICLIPFRPLPVVAATNPVKFYEYLAAGKAVVTSDLPELRPYSDLIYLAHNAEEFETAVIRALTEDSEEKQARRRCFARENSWEARYQTLAGEIEKLLSGPPLSRRSRDNRVSPGAPMVHQIRPATIRISMGGTELTWSGEMILYGRNFSPTCVVHLDEQPIPTIFVSPTELRGWIPLEIQREPGCRMITVVDQTSWKQSNQRVFLVERL